MLPEYFRHGQRFRLSFPLLVRIQDNCIPLIAWRDNSPSLENTCTENISSGGCYFLLSRELPMGTKLELEITIPGGLLGVSEGKLYCRGKVIRVEDRSESKSVGVASTIDSYHFAKASEAGRDSKLAPVV